MHEEIRSELEGYLSGETVSRSFTRHLNDCPPCARELDEMQEISLSLHALRLDDAADEIQAFTPRAGFYARIVETIEAEQKSPVWGLFAPDLQFFRKIAFASLMLLAVLGSYFVSRESDYATPPAVSQATLTEHNATVAHDGGSDRQHMLVTLASYEH